MEPFFLATCALFCTALRRALPFPEISVIGTKFRYLAAHQENYDVLFVGSSRFFHQIIPKQFDEAIAEATGQKLRSFNIGCDALWPPESYYYLRKILALRSPRLRWVVIEMMDYNPRIVDPEKPTKREAYWHDWPHTVLAWKTIRDSRPPEGNSKTELYLAHARILAQQWLNMGRGSEMLVSLLAPPKERPEDKEGWIETEGFRAEPNQDIPAADLSKYMTAVNTLREMNRPAPMSPLFLGEVQKVAAETRARQAEPIFVIAPTLNPGENYPPLPGGLPLLAFNDPSRFPALYDPAVHYDGYHLNEKGAVIFTRLLAEQFAAFLAEKPDAKSEPQK